MSYQYYLTNCITEHHFIGKWAEFYGLSHQKHMRKQYPTNPTDTVIVRKVGVKFSKRKTWLGKSVTMIIFVEFIDQLIDEYPINCGQP